MRDSQSLFQDAAEKALSRLSLARAAIRTALRDEDTTALDAWLTADEQFGWIEEVSGLLERAKATQDPERQAAIAACPTPMYHDTHRYCPSCPWTEDDGRA